MITDTMTHMGARGSNDLIGRNVVVQRNNSLPKAYRFMIGDNSEVEIL